jgi:hypothetical protein
MTKVSRQFLTIFLAFFISPVLYAQTDPTKTDATDVLQGINFDETDAAIKDVDISSCSTYISITFYL